MRAELHLNPAQRHSGASVWEEEKDGSGWNERL